MKPLTTDFCEHSRALDFARPISVENFRQPNFRLVAEVLSWLVTKYAKTMKYTMHSKLLPRFDPDYDLPLTIDSEQDRVIFIKTAALFFVQRARIKVNPKKLYQADG